ncbi:MAG: acyl dehydratase [Cycloclasticus sp.]|nr:acyl dehydratase [Cycloclasticus sp.]MBQ0789335.1 acyl dehydratase [Cycloclasticus sp.]
MKEVLIEGPYFEDFKVGEFLEPAPSVTVTDGHVSAHQMLFGDRLRLPLDQHLCAEVTGSQKQLANPTMAFSVAIGQTTYATQNVMGNLFYRGLVLKRPVFIGDTLSTTTKIVALRQNKAKTGRPATGMVALEILTTNQHGDEIVHFWRCPMVPCRDPAADTGHNDDLNQIPSEISVDALSSAAPSDWNLDLYKQKIKGCHFDDVEEGVNYRVKARDTVTSAPELTRLTLNLAMTHTDAGASVYGKRLVYGGHTISIAAAQMVRALPNVLTLLAWTHCDHVAPVFENDILRSEISILKKTALETGGGLVELHIKVWAERGDQAPKPAADIQVLDWGLIVFMA